VAWKAAYVAERLDVTGHDYVPPDTANKLFDFVSLTKKAAAQTGNVSIAGPLHDVADALYTFVQRFAPRQTDSGKFIFRPDEDDQ